MKFPRGVKEWTESDRISENKSREILRIHNTGETLKCQKRKLIEHVVMAGDETLTKQTIKQKAMVKLSVARPKRLGSNT